MSEPPPAGGMVMTVVIEGVNEDLSGRVAEAISALGLGVLVFTQMQTPEQHVRETISDPEFERRVRKMLRTNRPEFEAWVRLQSRISGGRWPISYGR